VEEGLAGGEIAGDVEGVAVAVRVGLLDEDQAAGVVAGGVGVGVAVAGADDHGDLLDAAAGRLLGEDAQGGLLPPVAVDERLQRDRSLGLARGRDDRLANLHGGKYPRPWVYGQRRNC